MTATDFACFLVEKDAAGKVSRGVARRTIADLPQGDVLVHVAFSSLNYKDALACEAHPRRSQAAHVPGIDAAGTVVKL
jgi:NADPH:quinone reductase-like Zn-dependent oxidoreductase